MDSYWEYLVISQKKKNSDCVPKVLSRMKTKKKTNLKIKPLAFDPIKLMRISTKKKQLKKNSNKRI